MNRSQLAKLFILTSNLTKKHDEGMDGKRICIDVPCLF